MTNILKIENPFKQSRRDFMVRAAAVGGGLAVGFGLPATAAQGSGEPAAEVGLWVLIQPDDGVVIRYARSEMGQGSMTSAPMLVAEELGCDWNKVRVENVDTNANLRRKLPWGPMGTYGSMTIRSSQEYLRRGGAVAREMLVAAAAQQWGVPAAECKVDKGVIAHATSKRRTTFGKVAEAASKLQPPTDVALKDPKDWTIAGKPIKRVDIPASVNGTQRYGIDTQLPGMLYAAMMAAPVFGAKLKSFDASRIQGRRGIVRTMAVGDGAVAVVADNWWRAKEALKDVTAQWDEGRNGAVSSTSITESLRAGLAQAEAAVAHRTGDADKALASAAKVLEADYFTPYLAHSPLEPMGATAQLKDGRLDIWLSTQNSDWILTNCAKTLGMAPENIYVHRTQNGGGFGRRGAPVDYAIPAVLIAKAMEGTPVKLLWTREEDTTHDYYRPTAMYRVRGGLDASGNLVGLTARIASPSIAAQFRFPLKDGVDSLAVEGFHELPYEIPNLRIDFVQRDTHVPVGFWRAVGWSQTPFARESFIDELAHAAGKDPFEFRRAMLAHEKRPLGVLEAAAKAAGWGEPLPQGVFRGIAVTEPYGSFAAAVIEVSVDKNGGIRIRRVVQAIDPGYAVNPDNIRAQMEGCTAFALTMTMWGEITIKEGRAEQMNFDTYRMMRLSEMPKVETVLVPSGGFWGGVGEPSVAPVAPALCNAIFAATGKRIRSLPLKNEGISMA